jgi:acyl carrier protein
MKVMEQVTEIINRSIDWQDEIRPDDRLKEDLEIDSLDVMMIIQEIEDEFDIVIDTQEIKCLETVQNIVEKLSSKLDLPVSA